MKPIDKKLKQLYEISHPRQLKQSCEFLFFFFLMNNSRDELPDHISEISSDIYMLIDFLEFCEENLDTFS